MSSALSDSLPRPAADLRTRIAALADQCVKCGLCQPQCPTYHVARQEAESPRGRIALAKALAQGALDAAGVASATRHLDQCLACMRCERVCPSQVRYGELIVAARELQREAGQPLSGADQGFSSWLKRPRLLAIALRIANLPPLRQCIQSVALRGVWQRLGLERAVRELPRLPPRPALRRLAPRAESRGRVGLFLGCVAASADRDVHAAARYLLGALGYQVIEPQGQGCCGALALHGGDVAGAHALSELTRRAFVHAGVDTVLVSASGCFGTLRDLTFGDRTVRVREIHEFLAADAHLAQLAFRPLPQRVALHTPCTQANVARADGAIRTLLQRIPQMDIAVLPDMPGCCGAAGDYFLRHADVADALRAEKLDQVAALMPQVLVTSNVGCRIFLDNGLRQRAAAMRVLHPIVLLAQQLDN
jgi:glycolate oxidase iron-sulfur subunit